MSYQAVLDELRGDLGRDPKADLVARLKLELVDLERQSHAASGGLIVHWLHFDGPGFVRTPPLRLDGVEAFRKLAAALRAAIARAEALTGEKAISAERSRYAAGSVAEVLLGRA